MKLGLRLFLGFFLIVGLSAWLLLKLVIDEVKPVVRQVSEDNLVEVSRLLAAMVTPQFARDRTIDSSLADAMAQFSWQSLQIPIWDKTKTDLHLRVYITDELGIVVYDSTARDVGKDYARWNDVYLTLRGQYGARTTRDDPSDEFSSAMYVAAPIKADKKIIGVLTAVLPNRNHLPYLSAAQTQLKRYGAVMIILSLLIGVLTTAWLIRALRQISLYAERISHEPGLTAPQFARGTELEKLMQSLQAMREALDGKAYVEDYVHALTHELKSPLAATKAAQEILQDENLSTPDRQRFLNSIATQADRMQALIDKLLLLAKVEQQRELPERAAFNIQTLLDAQGAALAARLKQKSLQLVIRSPAEVIIIGDAFLLNLALSNLFENAINHALSGSTIAIELAVDETQKQMLISVHNHGDVVPDFALPRLGQRFYALTRADGQRGSGLGLRLVNEIARLHNGHGFIRNHNDGVVAGMVLSLD